MTPDVTAGDGGTGRRPRAVFYTLGCKANLYDTACMMNRLRDAGWEVATPTHDRGAARARGKAGTRKPSVDLFVINSCAVTARAESKSRQLARSLKRRHPGALVALVGCYSEINREQAAQAAGVDFVLGTADREALPELVAGRGLAASPGEERIPGAFAAERTRAAVKVQDGCEQFCSYCVIPYARGPCRSRPAEDVLDEVSRLVKEGFREVVLTGIHLGRWGSGASWGAGKVPGAGETSGPRLADLVRRVAAVPGLARVRLSSIEPMEITDELLDLIGGDPRVCRHLHVPLQSGSDRVLERMNRGYTAAEYLAVVDRANRAIPGLGLTTDVMVGFPGEEEDDFEATLDVVRRARFSRLHVFRYSRRPNTAAADMPGQVSAGTKKARSERVIALGRELALRFHQGLIGRKLEVLVEKVSAGRAEGLTDNYARAVFAAKGSCPNDIVPVRVVRATASGISGEIAG